MGLYALREKGHSTVDTKSFDGLFDFDPMAMPRDAANTPVRLDLTATSLAAFGQESLELPGLRFCRFGASQLSSSPCVNKIQTVRLPRSRSPCSYCR